MQEDKLRGVIYARYSSDNQRAESIDAQVYEIEKYARANGISIINIYTDEAKSATTDNRPSFKQMIADARRGVFDIVLVHKLDRFARSRYDSVHYKRLLKLADVKLISVSEAIDQDEPMSVLMESLLEGMAEYYSLNLAKETMKGMDDNARKHKHNGGRPPLGLDVDSEGQYIISSDVNEVNAVRLIFDMYDQNYGYGAIIDELNNRGYATKAGNKFGKNSIHDILKNEKYTGTYTFNRAASKRVDGKRNHHLSKPTGQIVRVEDAFPALIDKNLFERVRAKMGNRKHKESARFRAKHDYLLSGLVFCGECKSAMVGNSVWRESGGERVKYTYYECNKRDRQHDCDNPPIRADVLDEIVLSGLYTTFFDPARLPDVTRTINEGIDEKIGDRDKEIESIKNNLEEVTSQVRGLVKACAQTKLQPRAIMAEISRLEDVQAGLELTLNKLNLQRRLIPHALTEMEADVLLGVNREFVEDRNISACKRFIGFFVEYVTVSKEDVYTSYFWTPSGPEGNPDVLDASGGGGGNRTHRPEDRPQEFLRAQAAI